MSPLQNRNFFYWHFACVWHYLLIPNSLFRSLGEESMNNDIMKKKRALGDMQHH